MDLRNIHHICSCNRTSQNGVNSCVCVRVSALIFMSFCHYLQYAASLVKSGTM